ERDAREVHHEGRRGHRWPSQLQPVPPLSGANRRKGRAGQEMMGVRTMVVTGGVAAALVAQVAAQPRPALETVLDRAGAYVLELQRQLAGIVAEENYVQD